jgi:hypothetical protein
MPENGRAQLNGLGVDVVEVLDRMPQGAAPVGSEIQGRLQPPRFPIGESLPIALVRDLDLGRNLFLGGLND